MSQITQNADGTYTKSYSDAEIALIKQLHTEMLNRQDADNQLFLKITSLENRVDVLEGERFSLSDLQNAINANMMKIEANERRIEQLEDAVIVDAYSKTQMDAYMIPWKVEEINRVFDTPTNEMFDEANLTDIKVGYKHFLNADINEPYGFHVLPNTMRRYTIIAYTPTPTRVTFGIFYADRCVVYLNGVEKATYQEDGGNFGKTQKVLQLDLQTGWNTIQFLLANQTQEGGLVVNSDLVSKVSVLSSVAPMTGRFTGDQIQAGTLDERHFSENMDITLKKIHATTTSEPAGVFGDPDRMGAIQIGDGVISKSKDEPFVVGGDLKVDGYIRDKDGNILDGGGGRGLTTADREKLDSIEWGAEVNQNAFSYVKLVDLPATEENPFQNVINAIFKMDTLRIRGDLGITFDIETVIENGEERQQMVIKNSPTEFKEHLFISEADQDTFSIDPSEGKFQLGRGTVQVYIEGIRQSYANFYEVDEWTIRLREKVPEGLKVLVVWQEGSPQFAKETIVSLANIPIASRTQDGLMSRFHVEDLYDHKHSISDLTDLKVFKGIEIDDGETKHRIDADGLNDIRLRAGVNIKLERLNDVVRISSLGPEITAGRGIHVGGSPETGYQITNTQRLEATRGLVLEHIEGIDVLKGPVFVEGKGIDVQVIDDVTYKILNNMSLTSLGGIEVTGNAEEGYIIKNSMLIEDDPEGGIEVSGDPVRGYRITNRMNLTADGIIVEGDARKGYHLKNALDIQTNGGLRVIGDPAYGITIENIMKLIEAGGIEITGNPSDGYRIKNALSLQASADGCVVVTGSAATGYTLTGRWPSITSGTGIAVDSMGDGKYLVKNTGVTSYNGQTGEVTGVGSLNKVAEGRGTRVVHHGNGDYVVHNTGVVELIDDGIGGGIDVQDMGNQVWKIKNTGIIKNIQGEGISVVTNSQGESTISNTGVRKIFSGPGIFLSGSTGEVTITNTGVHRVMQGRGIIVTQSGNDVTIHNNGIVALVEGEGIDINTNAEGTATVRNTGVLSWNGQTGHVNYTPPEPPKAQRGVVTTIEFFGAGERYGSWIRAQSLSTCFYCWAVKEPSMKWFNILVECGVDNPGSQFEAVLYTGDSENILDRWTVRTVRAGMVGEEVLLRCRIDHIPDWYLTGVHVGMRNHEGGGYGYMRISRAWVSIDIGQHSDYQI